MPRDLSVLCAFLLVNVAALGTTTYTYTGNNFTLVLPSTGNPYTTSDFISFSLTFDAPLPSNLDFQTTGLCDGPDTCSFSYGIQVFSPADWSASDGVKTVSYSTDDNLEGQIGTGPTGAIISWIIQGSCPEGPGGASGPPVCGLIETQSFSGFQGDEALLTSSSLNEIGASVVGDPGTWSMSTDTPEPSALVPMALVIAALFIIHHRARLARRSI